ncbi:MAG: NUDIX hydrolase [Deltaproteobacteria bacterium]|nr:NUDIX hydrolase [Deltaproteobacteria bacterium]
MAFAYKYPRPALTADCVVFGLDDENLKVLLIQRDNEPFAGQWALPGGFAQVGEPLEKTAMRELEEETNLKNVFLEQLYTFSDPNRDPREHVVTVAYFALVNLAEHKVHASTDARRAAWFDIDNIPPLAFDHKKILSVAYDRLQGKIRHQPIGFELLPPRFTLRQLQRMYEKILNRKLDKQNFRKKMLKMGILDELDEIETDVAHRAARLYRFNDYKYRNRVKKGFIFEM